MAIQFSPRTIDALAEIISGGSANDPKPSIGHYRSAPALERFMRGCNVAMEIGSGSRVPTLIATLTQILGDGDDKTLTKIIEHATSPQEFIENPDRHDNVVAHLNKHLEYDGYQLRRVGLKMRLEVTGTHSLAATALASTAVEVDFDTVSRDLERALASAASDPEDAITAACSTIESVCRSILIELDVELPAQKDIQGLYKALRGPLRLSPSGEGLPEEVSADVRAALSGLITTVQAIGALRTHAGDAHGREKGATRVDSRIARLAVHSASAVALFLIETWQFRFPHRKLPKTETR